MDGKSQRELKEKKRRHDQRAWFWIPFAVTLSLLVLLAGLVTVEVRCRQMGLGDYTPPWRFPRSPATGPSSTMTCWDGKGTWT